jgi:hypothetical protein
MGPATMLRLLFVAILVSRPCCSKAWFCERSRREDSGGLSGTRQAELVWVCILCFPRLACHDDLTDGNAQPIYKFRMSSFPSGC